MGTFFGLFFCLILELAIKPVKTKFKDLIEENCLKNHGLKFVSGQFDILRKNKKSLIKRGQNQVFLYGKQLRLRQHTPSFVMGLLLGQLLSGAALLSNLRFYDECSSAKLSFPKIYKPGLVFQADQISHVWGITNVTSCPTIVKR